MAETRPFPPAKLICGIIANRSQVFQKATERLGQQYGGIDTESDYFQFDYTDYYEKQMGGLLRRKFVSFSKLYSPEKLSEIKLQTNKLEEDIRQELGQKRRVVNIDPGFLNASALVMATVKDFAHRIPLQNGIYAHLELLFGRDEVRVLDWTYPDFKTKQYHPYLLEIRRIFLGQLHR
jgi:hypothetical protein